MNIQSVSSRRRSVSTSIVSTTMAIKMQATKGAGPESAGALIGETILHELGHDLGHTKQLGGHDHDEKGVMTPSRVLDSTLRYSATRFSAGEREDDSRAARGAGQAQGPIAVAGPGYDGVTP